MTKKTTIFFATTDPGVGGVAQYNHSLVCYLACQGYQVTYLQPKGFFNQDSQIQEKLGIKHIWFDLSKNLDLTFVNSSVIDLIICSNSNPLANLGIKKMALQQGIPYVIVEGLVEPHLAKQFSHFLPELSFHYDQAQEVIAVSEDNLKLLRELFGLPSRKGKVIHYGRPPLYFTPIDQSIRFRLRQELDIPEDAIVCFTSARIETRKGYQYQMEAIKQLMNTPIWDSLYFVWAGGGIFQPELEGNLQQTVSNLGIEHKVIFLGQRNDVPDLLNIADIFVFPSQLEGMPLCIMEAMAKGLPVIASAVSGIPDELGDTGKLIADPKLTPQVTVNQLAETLQEWTTNPHLLKNIGEACKNRAEKIFTESRMLSETLAVIEKALTKDHMSPLIVIDGVFFQLFKTGIARVWKSLLQQWTNTDFAHHILLLDRANTAPKINGIRYRIIPPYNLDNLEGDRQMLQQICDEEAADLFISTYYTIPLNTPSVFMAYDMIPEIFKADLNHSHWRGKTSAIKYASSYIAISENTAKDLHKIFSEIPLESITVAHCGVNLLFSPPSENEINTFKYKYGIDKPYFLLGALGGYKNSILFFQAFAQMANKQSFELVATGAGSRLPPEWRQYTAGCTFHGLQLTDEELRLVYAGAVALVYPSIYEGFGMPVIEAMACGCPVITTPNASLPEVAGEAALYVKDDDVNGMADALCEIQKPSVRRNLIQAGLQQAQKFSWATMAEIVKEALLNVILSPLRLTDINYLIFPDWQTDEEELALELSAVIRQLANSSDNQLITLLIDTAGITEEDANLFWSGIAMNLMLEEELDLAETLDFSLISNLTQQQWQNLLPKVTAKITLVNENQETIIQAQAEEIVTLNGSGNNYVIFPDWTTDEEELSATISEVFQEITLHPQAENITLLVDITNAESEEEVSLFFSGIAMNLMLEGEIELPETTKVNFVNFTLNQWYSLVNLIKAKITLPCESLPVDLSSLGLSGFMLGQL